MSLSRLRRVELPSGRVTELGKLDYLVDAMGYARSQDLVYGIASRDRHGWLHRRPHLVTINRQGLVRDLGEVRRGVGGVAAPTAGAVAGHRLYLRDGLRLFTMDIDPDSTTYKSVLRVVRLKPVLGALTVDDLAADPVSGFLYGISTVGAGPAKVVSVDPGSGTVRAVADVRGVPSTASYTSVVLSGRALYAVHTRPGSRSRAVRIALSGEVREVTSWEPVWTGDAAGCLQQVPTPPPPPPTPTPRPPTASPPPSPTQTPRPPSPPPTVRPPSPPPPGVRPPSPRPPNARPPSSTPPNRRPVSPGPSPRPTATTPLPTPTEAAELPVRPTPSPTPRPTSRPLPPLVTPPVVSVAPRMAAVPEEPDDTVLVLRRWSLATLLMILTGAAAMAAQRRMRR
ncbi:DUF6923 family protein [Kribbella flavida]|uniref:DUF6923 family protein n=1 Tax=Kribbella flavida TaxID=182640 RepID=UPI001ED9745F|nr:hypothetical protein [Kribbella flavida]